MTSKFEQLIEYVINDEEAKAKELFHDIVVEKSREIYENLMQEEEMDEESDAERDDHAEKAGKKVAKDIEYDELHEEEEDDEELDESMGEELSDEVEMEEEGVQMEDDAEFDDEAEEDGKDLTHDMEKDHDEEGDIEDRVVDLEDKLDELMAEFESLMGDGIDSDLAGEEGDTLGGDAMAADDTMAFADESMMENITLAAAPKPVTTEPAGTNTKSTTAANSGAVGAVAKPVSMTGDTAKGRPAPTTQAVSSDKFQNEPATGSKKLTPATKPTLSQATGVNTKTPFPKG